MASKARKRMPGSTNGSIVSAEIRECYCFLGRTASAKRHESSSQGVLGRVVSKSSHQRLGGWRREGAYGRCKPQWKVGARWMSR